MLWQSLQMLQMQTLLRLHANIGQLVEPAAFWVWARTILHREAIDYFHKEKRYVHDSVELRDAGQELEYDQLVASRLTQTEMDWYLRRLPSADRDLLGLDDALGDAQVLGVQHDSRADHHARGHADALFDLHERWSVVSCPVSVVRLAARCD